MSAKRKMSLEVKTGTEYRKPLPAPDATGALFWKSAAGGELRLQHCAACDRYQHYPRALCTRCGATPEWRAHSGRGEVHTFTVIRQYGAPPFRDELPYVVAMIELEGTGGLRLMSNVTDCSPEDVAIGMRVEAYVVLAAEGIGIPYFRPRSN